MKKIAVLLVTVLLLPVFASAENWFIADEWAADDPRAELTDKLCELLGAYTGESFIAVHAGDPAEAADFATVGSGGAYLLLSGPDAFIRSLQGYTAQDLRTAVRPVFKLLSQRNVLYMTSAAADLTGEPTAERLAAVCDEDPGVICIARLPDAGTADYLTLTGTWDFFVDQEYCMSWEEAAEAAADGAALAVIFPEGSVPETVTGSMTFAFVSDVPDTVTGLFAAGSVSDESLDALTAALNDVCGNEEWIALAESLSFSAAQSAESAAYAQEHAETVDDLIRYLSQEGLYFYEF